MILCVIDNSIFSGEIEMIGKTLVHYEITAEIGKGGMGEVYQAKDTKLGRDVAIKVLPEEFALDTDRVARFQREAKLLASLNHPNIAAIYGLEESDGTHFLVMELIEGDTLSDRIKSGPIPVEEALKLALQMAEALEAAHEKGVIHRDLKPANIKVTPDGNVKILDFGLAKAYAGDQENMSPMDSPTISAAATQQGVILGTAAYMSPEQARGKPVDRRADIWAFGVVLYEMLTGKTAFQGEDVSVTLASVITSDANLTLLPPNIHPRVREVINRCLQKESKKRYSGISDVQYEIEQALSDPSGILVEPVTTVKPTKKLRVGLSWVAGALILGLIIAGVAVWKLKPPEPRSVWRFDYNLPEGQELDLRGPGFLAISPDGSQLVYITPSGLSLLSGNERIPRLIAGTDDSPRGPFFSPDGQSIGYWSQNDGKLKRIGIQGGTPIPLCDVQAFAGAIWCADDSIIYNVGVGSIKRVSASGGTPETLMEGERIVGPQPLPDGKSLLFTDVSHQQNMVVVYSLDSGEKTELFPGSNARYLPTGHLVYSLYPEINTLIAVAFDPDTLEVSGGHISIEEGVGRNYAISDSGNLIYVLELTGSSVSPITNQLVWVDRKGNVEPLAAEPDVYQFCKISPDGTKVALAIGPAGNHDIYIWDLNREVRTKFTFDEGDDFFPLWTPDSKRIVFYSSRGEHGLFSKAVDFTGKIEKLGSVQDLRLYPWSWSKDGNILVLTKAKAPVSDIAMLSMKGDREIKPLLQEDYVEAYPQISPDGKWMAYQSNEDGQTEIYVRPFPDIESRGRQMISSGGGHSPLWSSDGRELFYRNGDATMAVPVETDPTFNAGKQETLFRVMSYYVNTNTGFQHIPWDIHPKSNKFLMIKSATVTNEGSSEDSTTETPRKINIVLNFFEELKQKVPIP
jgi:serine/threonine protein kinase